MKHQHCTCWLRYQRNQRRGHRRLQEVRKVTGICIRCGELPAKVGRAMCETCLRENALAVRAHRETHQKRRAG